MNKVLRTLILSVFSLGSMSAQDFSFACEILISDACSASITKDAYPNASSATTYYWIDGFTPPAVGANLYIKVGGTNYETVVVDHTVVSQGAPGNRYLKSTGNNLPGTYVQSIKIYPYSCSSAIKIDIKI